MSLYNADGQINLTVVSGSSYTGAQAPDGSYYIVLNAGTSYTGFRHPCGAINAVVNETPSSAKAPNGSAYVKTQSDGVGYTFSTSVASTIISRNVAPTVASTTGGTFYVSGTTPSTLPAGSDAAAGTLAAPFASLAFALTQVPAAGNYTVLCDGTFSENNGGRLILNRIFTAPVVFDSYTGNVNNFIITNASGINGVVTIRGTGGGSNTQFRNATLRSSTDGNPIYWHNPANVAYTSANISFFDCIFEHKTQAAAVPSILLSSDISSAGLYFIRCQFKKTVGTSTTNLPIIIGGAATATISNQPYSDIGFWDCSTTNNEWQMFSNTLNGVSKFTAVRNTFQTQVTYGIFLGKDSSVDTTAKTTDIYIANNTLTCTGLSAHAILIGSNCMAPIIVKNNTITTTQQGIVCKGCTDAVVQNNTVTMNPAVGTPSAIYAKASTGTRFLTNTVNMDGSAFSCRAFSENIDVANKASNTELTGNTINASGANAQAIFWVDGTGSTGGGISKDNRIVLTNSATLGAVRGTTTNTLSAMQAAWVSVGLAGDLKDNDSRTTVS